MDVTTASAAKLVFPSYVGRKNRQPNPILLRVQKEDRSMPLKALTADYCVRRGCPYEAVRFNHGGGQVPEAKSGRGFWQGRHRCPE
ncbi:hypothetical protein NL676_030346 [Syzygium grande]|nr:hypothetical protein NL676_030346 [Syzygium grande]